MDMLALIPAQANAGETKECSSSAGLKPHNVATEELPMKFDCDSKNVAKFCEKLIDRASEGEWKRGGGNVLEIPDSYSVTRNLLTECGVLTEQETTL